MFPQVHKGRSVKPYFPDSRVGSEVGMLDSSPDLQTYRTEWAHHHWINNRLKVNNMKKKDPVLQHLTYTALTCPGQSLDQCLTVEVLIYFEMVHSE